MNKDRILDVLSYDEHRLRESHFEDHVLQNMSACSKKWMSALLRHSKPHSSIQFYLDEL